MVFQNATSNFSMDQKQKKNISLFFIRLVVLTIFCFLLLYCIIFQFKNFKKKSDLFSHRNVTILQKSNPSKMQIKLNCVHLTAMGNTSNHLISFIRAIQMAKFYSVKTLIIDPGFIFFTKSFYYDDIHVIVSENHSSCISLYTFFRFWKLPRLRLDQEINETFIDLFHNNLPKVTIPPNTLVIHIRSGDIFKDVRPHKNYGQPPCNFYLDVIKMKKWSNVILIAQDNFNPCVNMTKKFSIFRNQSWELDLSYLLNAENLVVSEGTIWILINFLSKKLKNLFMFEHPQPQIRDHMNCVAENEYRTVIKTWKHSNEQIEAMKTSKCAKWEFIKHRPQQENDSYVWENVI